MSWLNLNISTLHGAGIAREQIARTRGALDEAAREVSTGTRSDLYRDGGAGASEAASLRDRIGRLDNHVTSNRLLASRLEVAAGSLGEARSAAQGLLDLALPNSARPNASAEVLQQQARATLDQLGAALNASLGGVQLFSGLATDRRPVPGWQDGPAAATAAAIGAPPRDAAEAQARIAALKGLIDEAGPGYAGTFYAGTPSGEGRLSSVIDDGRSLSWGVQADDPALRQLTRGMAMLAEVDVTDLEPEAYEVWMKEAVSAIAGGIEGLSARQSSLAASQQELDRTLTRQSARRDVYSAAVGTIENVDAYEAATRVTALETQLNASYAVTARMMRLSFLNFL